MYWVPENDRTECGVRPILERSHGERSGIERDERSRMERVRGAVLVEFALLSLTLYLILAGGLEMGRAVFCSQLLQDVARTAARELAVTQLPATYSFDEAMKDCRVRQKIYDPKWLVIDLADHPEETLDEFFAQLPIVNQMLRPLMFVDTTTVRGRSRRLLRYPGALLWNSKPDPCALRPTEFIVGVPVVVERRGSKGYESIRWVPVVEEIRADPDNRFGGAFSVIARGRGRSPVENLKRGLVALRVNYPFQAAALSGFRSPQGLGRTNGKRIIIADDIQVTQLNEPPGRLVYPPVTEGHTPNENVGPNAGAFGLGKQFALGQSVRPYRKLISAQAVFRRESFDTN